MTARPLHPARWSALALAFGILLLHAAAAEARSRGVHGFSYGYTDDEGDGPQFAYGIVEPGGHSFTTMSGIEEWDGLDGLFRDSRDPVFWFRLNGEHYVVRDRDWVERATEITRPMREIGRRQGELGRIQSKLGRSQSEIGARQSALGAQQGALGARLGGISMRLAMRSRRGSDTYDLERERDEIQRRMEDLSARQQDLSEQQRPYAERQAELGKRQAALGELQRHAGEQARVELRRLAEDAVDRGVAERVRR